MLRGLCNTVNTTLPPPVAAGYNPLAVLLSGSGSGGLAQVLSEQRRLSGGQEAQQQAQAKAQQEARQEAQSQRGSQAASNAAVSRRSSIADNLCSAGASSAGAPAAAPLMQAPAAIRLPPALLVH
jgi:hypothetical protein